MAQQALFSTFKRSEIFLPEKSVLKLWQKWQCRRKPCAVIAITSRNDIQYFSTLPVFVDLIIIHHGNWKNVN